jgi:hypothetical protein
MLACAEPGEELGPCQVSQSLRHAPEVAKRPSEHGECSGFCGRGADLDRGPPAILGRRDRVLVVALSRLHEAHPREGSRPLQADRLPTGRLGRSRGGLTMAISCRRHQDRPRHIPASQAGASAKRPDRPLRRAASRGAWGWPGRGVTVSRSPTARGSRGHYAQC